MRLATIVAVLAGGCGSKPAPSSAIEPTPAATSPADATVTAVATAPRNWWEAENACPDGATVIADLPPRGIEVRCDKAGVLHGRRTLFWLDGRVRAEESWRDGDRDGAFRMVGVDGHTLFEGAYLANLRHGPWKTWHLMANQLASQGTYATGVRDGVWRWWDSRGEEVPDVAAQPVVDGWWKSETACPANVSRVGDPPPKSYDVHCFDREDNRHGPATHWHFDEKYDCKRNCLKVGKMEWRGHWRNDERHGPWVEYDVKGKRLAERSWLDGKAHGTFRYFHAKTGAVALEVVRRYDEPVAAPPGPTWWERGQAACPAGTTFHSTPSPSSPKACKWPDGSEHGPYADFSGGNLTALGIKHDGNYVGWVTFFHYDGTLEKRVRHVHGVPDGRVTTLRKDGTVEREELYLNGVALWERELAPDGRVLADAELFHGKHGVARTWDASGRPTSISGHRRNRPHGHTVEWKDGVKTREAIYDEGELVWERTFDAAGTPLGASAPEHDAELDEPRETLIAPLK